MKKSPVLAPRAFDLAFSPGYNGVGAVSYLDGTARSDVESFMDLLSYIRPQSRAQAERGDSPVAGGEQRSGAVAGGRFGFRPRVVFTLHVFRACRTSDWIGRTPEGLRFSFTRRSLRRVAVRGVSAGQVLDPLQDAGGHDVSSRIESALRRLLGR